MLTCEICVIPACGLLYVNKYIVILSSDLHEPTNLSATLESFDSITLQWTQPSEPDEITASVSCTPPSPGCAECTTSPCTITGLNPSTEYEFTVALNSGGCEASMSTALVKTKGEISCVQHVDVFLVSTELLCYN